MNDVASQPTPKGDSTSEAKTLQSDTPVIEDSEMDLGGSVEQSAVVETIDVSLLHVPHHDMKAAWPVLTSASTDARWIGCLKGFVDFELSKPPTGKLNITGRPSEVTAWVKDKKKHIVPSIKAGKYGKEWMGWWHNLQPPSRRDGDGVLNLRRVVPLDEWSKTLLKGGTAGIYTVIVALSWWVKTYPEDPNLWTCVDDVSWVLSQLLGAHQASKKRPADKVVEASTSRKRQKL
ncbi:hypothetical protein CVT24_010597 [Panaeolus cyanescens]|uniref:Uncharacterized protein n=1 Tax=Panaeolus cyanescens TaxID=181874 RepID=A0A409YVS6_9AGAR|nr:hypothetical protein CVT24_010597 [Panaeolus cyanescens]